MVDTIIWNQMQQYRQGWYETKQAVNEDVERAHGALHLQTKQWVRKLLPLDSVENEYQEIFHDRQLGPYTGLKDAYENGFRSDSFSVENPLDVEVLEELGHAAEEITVDAMDLPEQPPVDPDPWEPSGLSDDMKERLENAPDFDYE